MVGTDYRPAFVSSTVIWNAAYRISMCCENVFVECRISPDKVSQLIVYLQLQKRHGSIEMDSVQRLQQENLTVVLPMVARFRTLRWFADLDNDRVSAVVFAILGLKDAVYRSSWSSTVLRAACVPPEFCILVDAKGVGFLYCNERVLSVTGPAYAKANRGKMAWPRHPAYPKCY